ncbi:hypothetical protein PCCS19_00180 [Paenibacillus sp. CCS19]|uniref:WG repeat-containing protein n=1 Tax=Paenibacillus sp. CCS19 TaxID=3158387 RepID=UPI0025640775|nr:WG repeat-containing protein [Paenibacillus cellulosilyticus]GMK36965.1 hypothetical protein PCCS19_00180 [Paenibacillus cellulosilyticus]
MEHGTFKLYGRILLVAALIASLMGEVGHAANKAQDAIRDPGLRQAISQQLHTNDLTSLNLSLIESLDVRDYGIESLQGLELLTNLKTLYLSHNRIVDLTPLSSLKQLSHVDLEDNQVVSIEPLSFNRNIASVILNDNPLNSVATKQIVTWKNRSIPVSYSAVKLTNTSEVVVVNGDKVQLVNMPITRNNIVYYDLKEIAELLQIQLSYAKGKLTLIREGKPIVADPNKAQSGVVMHNGHSYVQLSKLMGWFSIHYREDGKQQLLNYTVKDKAPLFKVCKYAGYDNKCGYMNRDGDVVIPQIYAQAYDFSEGVASVYDGEWKVINKKGDVITDALNHSAYLFEEGLVGVGENTFTEGNQKYGFMDIRGKMQIPFQFEYAWRFSDGFAAVNKNGEYMYIDKQGKVAIPGPFSRAYDFEGGLAAVHTTDSKYLIIDSTGKIVGRSSYGFEDGYIRDGLIRVVKYPIKGDYSIVRYGFVNTSGKLIIPPINSEALPYSEGKTIVRTVQGEYQILDSKGTIISKLQQGSMYGPLIGFSEGLLPMRKDGKYGFIDEKGKWVIPAAFDYALPFKNGLAYVEIYDPHNRPGQDQSGYIDRDGNFVYGPTNVWLSVKSY